MQQNPQDIIIFIIIVSALIATLVFFMAFMFWTYRRRQNTFQSHLEQIKLNHEKTLLSTQLEIQEQTFQHISREIHDNINLSLTLAKLNLNTIDLTDIKETNEKVESSICLLSNSILELSNISKGLNSDSIIQQGLTKAVESEVRLICQAGRFEVKYSLSGDPIYLSSRRELIIFRIIQEAFNNILRHASAKSVELILYYGNSELFVSIIDDGVGFDLISPSINGKAGLRNMDIRARMLGGSMSLETKVNMGTSLKFKIPFINNEE